MINIILLGVLALVDAIKKEINIFLLLPVISFWALESVMNRELEITTIIAAIIPIIISLMTRQDFGLADALVLSVISLENGILNMLMVFLMADFLFIFFIAIKYGFRNKNKSFPFIPFLFIAYTIAKLT